MPKLTRNEAVEELAQYGIRGSLIYLIDIIPLIEMVWADGMVQKGERELLEKFVANHVKRVNKTAGMKIVSQKDIQHFLSFFLDNRPDPRLLKKLRSYVSAFCPEDENEKKDYTSSLLAECLDIAASSVREYPYGLTERFDHDEKRCFFEILDSLK